MQTLEAHEIFEIEVLDRLKSGKLLDALVFGGGTMLRLCFDLNRYSVDLDFWFTKKLNFNQYFKKTKEYLSKYYEITDAQDKYFTLLLELKSKDFPRRLKIEIRKKVITKGTEEKIAFSQYTTKQVLLKCLSLESMLKAKIEALLERKEIRDCFDIEFILRRGVKLKLDKKTAQRLIKIINSFKPKDYKVTLGSILVSAQRRYYVNNKFEYLLSKLNEMFLEKEVV